jgi:hypothetical protein
MDPFVESELPLHPSMICYLKQEAVFADPRQLWTARFILDNLNSLQTGVNLGVSDAALGQHQLSLPRAHII